MQVIARRAIFYSTWSCHSPLTWRDYLLHRWNVFKLTTSGGLLIDHAYWCFERRLQLSPVSTISWNDTQHFKKKGFCQWVDEMVSLRTQPTFLHLFFLTWSFKLRLQGLSQSHVLHRQTRSDNGRMRTQPHTLNCFAFVVPSQIPDSDNLQSILLAASELHFL